MVGVAIIGVLAWQGVIHPLSSRFGLEKIVKARGEWEYPGPNLAPFDYQGQTFFLRRSNHETQSLYIGDSNMEQYGPTIDAYIAANLDKSHSAVFAALGACAPVPNVRDKQKLGVLRFRRESRCLCKESASGGGRCWRSMVRLFFRSHASFLFLRRWQFFAATGHQYRWIRTGVVRNENYYGKKPTVERITFKIVPEDTTREAMLRSGQIDICYKPLPSNVASLKADPKITVEIPLDTRTIFMVLNYKKGVTTNKLVRQAFNYAVDKKAIVSKILFDTAIPMEGPVSPIFTDFSRCQISMTTIPKKRRNC